MQIFIGFNQFGPKYKVGKYQIHCCLKCFDNKNVVVVVASSDAEIYSVDQGDMSTTNRLCQKKYLYSLLSHL
jgi:hypothetical protein